MTMKDPTFPERIGVALVDGDNDTRHARQIMLRSERYQVRSYATCAALLADPRSRDYACIVVDLDMPEVDGLELLRQMRASGWRGKAVVLDGVDPNGTTAHEIARNGDTIFYRNIGDRSLVAAIAASVDRGCSRDRRGSHDPAEDRPEHRQELQRDRDTDAQQKPAVG